MYHHLSVILTEKSDTYHHLAVILTKKSDTYHHLSVIFTKKHDTYHRKRWLCLFLRAVAVRLCEVVAFVDYVFDHFEFGPVQYFTVMCLGLTYECCFDVSDGKNMQKP